MKRKSLVSLLLTLAILAGVFPVSAFGAGAGSAAPAGATVEWDLLDTAMDPWENGGIWGRTVGNSGGSITQKDGYVNVRDTRTAAANTYTWAVAKPQAVLPAAGFTLEVTARVNSKTETEGNEVSVRIGGKLPALFLFYGGEGEGAVRSGKGANSPGIQLDTTVWHTYTLVAKARDGSYVTTLYVDGEELAWYEQPVSGYTGGDLVRFGADNGGMADMDVQSVRMSSDIVDLLNFAPITDVLISNTGWTEGEGVNLQVTALADYADGTKFTAKVIRADGTAAAVDYSAEGGVQDGVIAATLPLPADIAVGQYRVQLGIGPVGAQSEVFEVSHNRVRPELPTFEAEGFLIDMEDYIVNPTWEFNFPSVVDTSVYGLPDGSEPLARYYMFYCPHDAPGGIMMMYSDSLDGPWTEYDKNPLVAKTWPREDGGGNYYSVSHVSSGDVSYNTTYGKYFMYFHGENNVTRYATSDNMLDWEYGGTAVYANDFSPTGTGHTEASYARVFEYEVPGLGNKYIMLLMINNTANMRKIYWAHSPDGIDWTAVTSPLLTPIDQQGFNYKGNFSGPFFFTHEGRNYVICHASTGNMYLFEVGQMLDEEIHWGAFHYALPGDPDNGRSGAPVFMQDDEGVWHVFYEGGTRLHANIVHGREISEEEKSRLSSVSLSVPTAMMQVGETLPVEIEVLRRDGKVVDLGDPDLTLDYIVSPEDAGSFTAAGFTAAKVGVASVSVRATMDGETVTSETVRISVRTAGPGISFEPGTPILDNTMTPGRTHPNINIPWVLKVGEKYHLYYDYATTSGGSSGIAVATADSIEGPYTPYNNGTPIMSGAGGASVMYNAEEGEYWMYYGQSTNVVSLATSADGFTWTTRQQVLTTAQLGGATVNNAYQVAVYEYPIEGKDNKYTMLVTVNPASKKALAVAWSDDGINWETSGMPLLEATVDDGGNIASPRLLVYGGVPYISFHNSAGNLEYGQLNAAFGEVVRMGTLYESVAGEPDRNRAADGFYYEEDGVLYLFYTARSNKGNGDNASVIALTSYGKQAADVLFFDDFEAGHSDNWAPEGGSWQVEDDGSGNLVYRQSDTAAGANNFAGDSAWQDYSVEADIVMLSGNGVITISGRVKDVNNRYTIGFNAGNLVVAKKVNGSDTQFYKAAYPIEAGRVYKLRIDFEGNSIRVYVDGELEYEGADSSLKSGRIGIATYRTAATFDNVLVRDLADAPLPATELKINDLQNYQVVQRSLDAEGKPLASLTGEVAVSGKSGDDAAAIEARVLSYDEGDVVLDWTLIDSAPADTFAGTLTVPQGGWYRLEVRSLNADGAPVSTKTGANKWGVGINILAVGQSNMMGQHKADYAVADDLVANYTTGGSWAHMKDPYHGSGASVAPTMGNELVRELGIPVGFVPAADSGSGLHQPNIGHAVGRYWLNRNEANPGDTSTIYGKAVTRAAQAGGVELIIWNQGETDGRLAIPKETYMEDMRTLLSRFRTDLGLGAAPMFIAQIGNHADNLGDTSTDLAYTAIRTAQRDLDDGVNFYLAATEMEFDRIDTAHYTAAAMKEIGRRYANAVLYYYGLSEYYRGPEIVSAQFETEARDSLLVTINHRGGTDFTPDEDISSFEVHVGDTVVNVAEATKVDATTIRLRLDAPAGEGALLRYLFGFDPERHAVVKDNTALQLPLEATGDEGIVIEDAEPAGTARETLGDFIAECEGLDPAAFTPASWTAFTAALAEAKGVYEDDAAGEAGWAAAYNSLTVARALLVKRADNSDLRQLVIACEALIADDYTAESWAALQEVLGEAREVLQNGDATEYQISSAYMKLLAAQDSLQFAVKRDLLEQVIAYARSIDQGKISEENAVALNNAIAEAEGVLYKSGATQTEVQDATSMLWAVIWSLDDLVDLDELRALVALVQGMNPERYTPDSWAAIDAPLSQALEVLGLEEPTQEQADAAYKALAAATTGLRLRANFSQLAFVIEQAEKALAASEAYIPASIAELDAALQAAKAVYADKNNGQPAVDAAAEALNAVLLGMRQRANKAPLRTAVEGAGAINLAAFTPASAAMVTQRIGEAQAGIADENLVQEDADALLQNLLDAVNGLVLNPDEGGGNEGGNTPEPPATGGGGDANTGGTNGTGGTGVRGNSGGGTTAPTTPAGTPGATEETPATPEANLPEAGGEEPQPEPQAELAPEPVPAAGLDLTQGGSNTLYWIIGGLSAALLAAVVCIILLARKKKQA